MSEAELDDHHIVERCLRGEPDAFGLLVDRYQRPVYHAIFHMVRNRDDAEDVAQQAFLKAFEKLRDFDPERRFFSWLYRIAINEAINHLKARRTWEPLLEERDYTGSTPDPGEELDAEARAHELQAAVLALKPDHRAVVVLFHFLHLSYQEASEALDLPEKTVKSRLFTARQILRDALETKSHALSHPLG